MAIIAVFDCAMLGLTPPYTRPDQFSPIIAMPDGVNVMSNQLRPSKHTGQRNMRKSCRFSRLDTGKAVLNASASTPSPRKAGAQERP